MDSITDPVALVDCLEPDALRERLRELDRQQRAVKVLLRAAVAREKKLARAAATPAAPPPNGGPGHAA